MSQTFLNPDRMQTPLTRCRHPFRRGPSAGRRWGMLLLLIVLCSIIGAYLWITDSRRVKALAETELSRIIGGPVVVGHANLSLFEGLRLENVTVYVDRGGESDARVFSANTFNVSYDLKSLLTGRLKLTRIVAIDPRVTLWEDLDTGKWNYQRMERPRPPREAHARTGELPDLPDVILRNAQIEYTEVRDGEPVSRASMVIEGQLAPSSDGHTYTFEMQSRGGSGGGGERGAEPPGPGEMGPAITGKFDRRSGVVTAALRYFRFGKDIRAMLPAQVRSWWDRHELSGAVDIPLLSYTPPRDGKDAEFIVETAFRGVNLTVRPEEWMSREEVEAHDQAAGAFELLRRIGMDSHGAVDRLAGLIAPSPIQLGQVNGTFTFTQDGITIGQHLGERNIPVSGSLEDNTFAISGHIDGYSPQSPAKITIASARMRIPSHPRYVTSMPHQVRELYDRLRPVGTCSVHVALDRPDFGGKLEVAGQVRIIDGGFTFDRFPYAVSRASGDVDFGRDPVTGWDQVKLVNLVGHGFAGGPNANTSIHIDGLIAPLTADVGVHVRVWGNGIQNEPALFAAFPPEVKRALHTMDADGKGLYPTFKGGFECRIDRPVGAHSPWIVETDLRLDDASGKPVAFPYLMQHVRGKLLIREGYVDIVNATMKKGDATLTMNGRVIWRAGAGGTPLLPGEKPEEFIPARPDLKIVARNVPLDQDLRNALPPERRKWLEKIGLSGTLDIDGRIWRDPAEASEQLTHAFDLTLHHGAMGPLKAGGYAVSDIAARMRLLPDRLIITELRGRRGKADIVARGQVGWPDNKPSIFLSGTASRLALDQTLYAMLPASAQSAWDAVSPRGTVDVDLTYRGGAGISSPAAASTTAPVIAAGSAPSTQPQSSLHDIDLIIHPVDLSATVRAVPYRLDHITGAIRLHDGRVLLSDLTGRHGEGMIRIAGDGYADHTDWDLRIAGQNITVDDAFSSAMPQGLASVIKGIKFGGKISFDFPKLAIRTSPPLQAPAPDDSGIPPPPPLASATTAPAGGSPLDIDFAVKMAMNNASMNLGVPVVQASGTLDLTGNLRRGKLADLSGPLDLTSLQVAGRSASNFHAEFYKPPAQDALRIGRLMGDLAGGNVAGQVDLGFPDNGPSRYVVNLVLRDADVRQLSGELSPDLSGELSASLAVEGDWSDPKSRRGRGDVTVSGKEMYKIPLVLGLLQVTNLALPISSPFNQASARYSVDGQTVTFDSLELRSHDMLMSGSGQLNFASKEVNMTFVTDNPSWPKIPIISDLMETARHELLQIHVKGTLQEPKVTASAANTLTTTVDQVLRGETQH